MSRFSEFYNRLSFRNTVSAEVLPTTSAFAGAAAVAGTASTAGTADTAAVAGVAERININGEPDNVIAAVSEIDGGGFETKSLGPYSVEMEGLNPFIIRGNRDDNISNLLTITPDTKGDCVAELKGALVNVSDGNLKNDIKTLENVSDKIRQIRGVRFKYTQESGLNPEIERLGVIAQEVEKVFPELVIDSKRGYKTMDYVSLSAVLLQAVKEQQQQIDNLK
tara:strand:+ start:483 stop:1148 length:666 start_codon:yes stop_codon:yes gene_type:complete